MSTRKVFIYSTRRSTTTGVSEFVNDTSGKSLNKSKIGQTKDTLRALYSPKIGGLANYISYTQWLKPDGSPYTDEKGHPLMLQSYFEEKYNLPTGYLTNRAWRKGDSIKDEDLTYFQKASWKMNDGCTVFDLSTLEGEMGYYVMLASHLVANSEKEYLSHKWPKAIYYIAHENESEEIKYTRNELKTKAFATLHSSDLTDVYKRKLVSLLGLVSSKSQLTSQQVHNLLFEYIDKSTFTSGSNIDKFNAITSLLSTPDGREQFEARYILQQALDLRIIYEKQDTYTWVRPQGTLVLGERYQEAVDFILNPKKTLEVEELQAAIAKKLQ